MRSFIICLALLSSVLLADTLVVESYALPQTESQVALPQANDDSDVRPFFPEWLEDSEITPALFTDQVFLGAITVLGFFLTVLGLLRGK